MFHLDLLYTAELKLSSPNMYRAELMRRRRSGVFLIFFTLRRLLAEQAQPPPTHPIFNFFSGLFAN